MGEESRSIPSFASCASVCLFDPPPFITIHIILWHAGLPWHCGQSVSSEREARDRGASPQPDPILPPTALRTQSEPAAGAEAESGQMVTQHTVLVCF